MGFCNGFFVDVDFWFVKICVVDNYIIVFSRGWDYEGFFKF